MDQEPPRNPEQRRSSRLTFITEADPFGRLINADGVQVKLPQQKDWLSLLLLTNASGQTTLNIISPDESHVEAKGTAWFIYLNPDSGKPYLKATQGQFKQSNDLIIIASQNQSNQIFDYIPESQPDMRIESDRSLQPIAFVYKDQGQFVFARRYIGSADLVTNTAQFHPADFEFTYPNAREIQGAKSLIAEWTSEQQKELNRRNLLKAIKENLQLTALRLAHKHKNLPSNLVPECNYIEKSEVYEVTLFVTQDGLHKIIGDQTQKEPGQHQIGTDFAFGDRVFFVSQQQKPDIQNPINGSLIISHVSESSPDRTEEILIDEINITPDPNRTYQESHAEEMIYVWRVHFASKKAEKIIRALVGMERGLKPKYLPPGEIKGT